MLLGNIIKTPRALIDASVNKRKSVHILAAWQRDHHDRPEVRRDLHGVPERSS